MDARKLPTFEELVAPFRRLVEGAPDGYVPPPVLLWATSKIEVIVVPGDGDIQDNLAGLIPRTIMQLGRPTWCAVVSEAYADLNITPGNEPEYGDLRKRAQSGDNAIKDVVMSSAVHVNGQQRDGILPFRRVAGQVEWHPLIDMSSYTGGGAIPDLLRSALRPNPFLN